MSHLQAKRQKGATLLVCMIMLLIVTLLTIANVREVTLEERITSNMRDRQGALNGAESALREGEARLAANFGVPVTTGNCGSDSLCVLTNAYGTDAALNPTSWTWWTTASNSRSYTGPAGDSTQSLLASTPRWNTAFVGFDPANSRGMVEVTDPDLRSKGVGPYYYQVNAASQGTSDRVMVTLQTVTVQRY
jgi:type IV pilus assembly protein PilX